MELPITHQSLESLASAGSFARGENYYYSDLVGKVVFDGQRFTAKVQGTYWYQVEISGSPTATYAHCSCPYDWGGICKHIVAVGLAILDGKFNDASDDYENTEVKEKNQVLLDNFDTLFDRTENSTKTGFLQQLLAQNTQLKQQFVKYVATQQHRSVESMLDERVLQIENRQEEVTLLLESLTFDEEDLFPPNYYENGGYYDEWEDAEKGATKIIREGLTSTINQAQHYFQQGELTKGLSVVLGIYEGIFMVTSPSSDPLGIVDNYPERVKEVFIEQSTTLFQSLNTTVKAELEVEAAVDLLFSRYQHYEKNPASSPSGEKGIYHLKEFEAFLLVVIIDTSIARFMLQRLREEDLVDVDTVHVVLYIAEKVEDDTLWINTAQEFLDFDPTLAQPLLEKFFHLGNTKDFLQTAQQVFQQVPQQIADYLARRLPPELSLDLYKQVYSYLVKQFGHVEHYQKIRPYMSENEKSRLIQSVKANDVSYVQLLALEERYEDILHHVQRNTNLDYHIEKLVEPILSVYPSRCFVMLEKKCWWAIEQRGRSVYKMIVRWLQLMQQIPGHRDEAEALATQFYHHKPNLPALRDEMRKAGVSISASYR